MNPLTWQNPGQLFVAQDIIKVNIYSVAELRVCKEQVQLPTFFLHSSKKISALLIGYSVMDYTFYESKKPSFPKKKGRGSD